MSTRTTYPANCHCGAIKFTVTLDKSLEETTVMVCNCSYCTKAGLQNVYPKREDISFIRGEDVMTGYIIRGAKLMFCPKCGTNLMCLPVEDDDTWAAVSVRSFEENDKFDFWDTQKVKRRDPPYDGRSRDPKYVVPE